MTRRWALTAALAAGLLGGLRAPALAVGACAGGQQTVTAPTTIASALSNLPANWLGDYCIYLNGSAGSFPDGTVVDLSSAPAPRNMNGFRLIVTTVTTPATISVTTSNNAITVRTASVTLQGITFSATATGAQWGVFASSNYVALTSVTVQEGGINWAQGGVSISSLSWLTYSSIFASVGVSLLVDGSSTTVAYSTVTANIGLGPALNVPLGSTVTLTADYVQNSGAGNAAAFGVGAFELVSISSFYATGGGDALALNRTSSSTVDTSYFNSSSGSGVRIFNGGAYGNLIQHSTISVAGASQMALVFTTSASSNTAADLQISAPAGYGVVLTGGANYNTVAQSTIVVANATNQAVSAGSVSSNTFVADYIENGAGKAFSLTSGNNNGIVNSTVTAGGGLAVVHFSGSPIYLNSVAGSVVAGTANGVHGIDFDGGAKNNTVDATTVTVGGGGAAALVLNNSSSNTITRSYFLSPAGNGGHLVGFANYNSVDQSTFTGGGVGNSGVFLDSSYNTITRSVMREPSGNGVDFDANAIGDTVSLSTMAGSAVGTRGAFFTLGSASNTVSQCYLTNGAGDAAAIDSTGGYNKIQLSTMVATAAGGRALLLFNSAKYHTISGSLLTNNAAVPAVMIQNAASSNTITQSIVLNPAGDGIDITGGAAACCNQISQSSVTSAGSGFSAVNLSASSTTILSSVLNGPGLTLRLNAGADYTNVILSTMIAQAGTNSFGMYVLQASTIGVDTSYIQGDIKGLYLDASAQFVRVANSSMVATALNATGRAGLFLNDAGSTTITGSLIQGATAALILGSTDTVIQTTNVNVVPSAFGGDGIVAGAGGKLVTVGTITISDVPPPNVGLAVNAVGPLTVIGAINSRGLVFVSGTAVNDGAFSHSIGRDYVVQGVGASYNGGASTLTFNGAANGVFVQEFRYPTGAKAGAIYVAGSTVTFKRSGGAPATLTMGTFRDTSAVGRTLTFGAGDVFNITDFNVRGTAPAQAKLISTASPGQWNLNVAVSSVTGASVQDSNAAGGATVTANDGTVLDAGNNVNWNFQPQLVVELPGHNWVDGQGFTGQASSPDAGAPFPIIVRAVSASSTTVTSAGMTVTLQGTDPFQSPSNNAAAMTQPLVSGATTFSNVSVRVAEGPGRVSTFTAAGAGAFASAISTLTALSAPWTGLQVIVPSEVANPGATANGGKLLQPDVAISTQVIPTFSVRLVDSFNNVKSSITVGAVRITGTTSSTATFQSTNNSVVNGVAVYTSTLTFYSTGTFTFTVATAGGGPSVLSSPITVASLTTTSPTVHVDVDQSTVPTLGGYLTGTAADVTAVSKVLVAVSTIGAGASRGYYTYPTFNSNGSFSSATPVFATATLQGQSASVNWNVPVPDAALKDKTSYYVQLYASNASNNTAIAYATFTFMPSALGFGGNDGQGSATVFPLATAGCEPIIATVTFTVGAAGIQPGGGVAVQVPQSWTPPHGIDANNPPGVGFAYVASNAPGFTDPGKVVGAGGSPISGQPGVGWLTMKAGSTPFNPGDKVVFTFAAVPPLGPDGRGSQFFTVVSRGAGNVGSFQPIAAPPAVNLTPGTTAFIAFKDPSPLALGPLQTSSTMQLALTDLCGNLISTDTVFAATITINGVNQFGVGVDTNATVYLAGGVAQSSVAFPAFSSFSQGFYYQTSTAGVAYELIQATALAKGRFIASYAEADRAVNLLISSLTLSNISVDTGTITPGQTKVYITSPNNAVVRFSPSVSGAPWSVTLSTDNAAFYPPRFTAYGVTDASHPVSVAWNGVDAVSNQTPQFLPGGTFYVLIQGAGGAVRDASLQVIIPPSPYVNGNLGAVGAAAEVSVIGPGAGFANNGVATSTGYFQVFGLVSGQYYAIQASTAISVGGQGVTLSTSAVGVAAGVPPVSQTLSFPTTAFMRVSVGLPRPVPHDLTGEARLYSSTGALVNVGSLHFNAGSALSDNGAQAFGQAASTWTILLVTPDTYTLQVNIPDVRVSTQLSNILVGRYTTVDEAIRLPPKASVYGWAVIPSTTPFGAPVSIEGRLVGVSTPSVFGGAFIQPWSANFNYSSGPYALFGLDPGSWTITAKALGFLSTSTVVSISSGADLGDPTFQTPGVLLTLSAGGVIAGTVKVPGDTTSGVTQCIAPNCSGVFDVAVQAYNLATFESAGTVVRLTKDAVLAQSTFSIGGLTSGPHVVRTFLNGFNLSPPGGQVVVVSTPAVTTSTLTLAATNAAVQLNIQLPKLPGGGCHPLADFHKIGFEGPGPQFGTIGRPDITQVPFSTQTINCSSMTVVTPPQLTGFAKYQLVYAPTGASAIETVPLSGNATTVINADLNVATFTLSGRVSFSGAVQLPVVVGQSTFTVAVSTLGGILQIAPTNYFCLISSTGAQGINALHMELIPLDPENPGSAPAFQRPNALNGQAPPYADPNQPPFSQPACGIINPESPAGDLAIMGYLAPILPDGSFAFPGVPAGDYILRNAPDLDLNPADGNEIGYSQQFVRVSTNVTGLRVSMDQGVTVSGLIVLPPGMTTSRLMMLFLKDARGNTLAEVPLGFNNAHAVPYVLPNVANGVYSLVVRDFGFPTIFAAKPLALAVAGQPLTNRNVQLHLGGNITATLAIQQVLADGSKQFVLITPQNRNLLPAGLKVDAIAQPWFDGGFYHANSPNCGLWGCTGQDESGLVLDPTGKLQIQDVLPGAYNVEFAFPNGSDASATGGLALVSAVKAGVTVAPGETVDLGVVSLVAGVGLSGRVTDVANSTPIANATMVARPSLKLPGQTSGRVAYPRASTDQNGRYAFTGLDPAVRYYDVFAADRDIQSQGVNAVPYEQGVAPSVDIQSTATLNFALSFASFSVSGQVAGAPGDQLLSGLGQGQGAVPGAVLFLQKSGVVPTKNPLADVVFLTDANGDFTIPNLTAGSYRLYATALGYGTYSAAVTIGNASVNLGAVQLVQGASLSGSIRKPDGSLPSEDDAQRVVGATSDLSDFFFGLLTRDPITRGITGYRLSGFKPGLHYKVIFLSADDELATPSEASDVVFLSSSEARGLDVTFRPRKPYVTAKASRAASRFKVTLRVSQPLRERLLSDDNLSVMLTTFSAQGFVSSVTLSLDRRELSGLYTPGVSESSFTLKLSGYSAIRDPDSLDPINPEFVVLSTPTFFIGTDGASALNINNVQGGGVVMEGDQARLTLPKGAFSVDASSGVQVVFQKSIDALAGAKLAARGTPTVEANIRALRYAPAAYPSSLFQAMAALPPDVSPFSAFYDVLLPLGIRTALAKPVQMTVSYSTSTVLDPAKLNLYWFNAAANAYVLQQDVTGAQPVIDTVNHTITINVNHFSTFVLFNTGVNVITGATFGGGEITAYNFPNPFDLSTKQVQTIHGGGTPTVRGTMISIGVPLDVNGDASLKIFNVAGERVRTIDLGSVAGGSFYYQAWDGRNDSGRDVASGVYIGQVKIGGKSKFFKMALIK